MTSSFDPAALAGWRQTGIVALLCLGVFAFKAGEGTLARYKFGLNVTESLPHWAFVTDRRDREVGRGDLVEFVAPDTPYYPAGQHFVKRVAGTAGDVIERRGDRVWVAGKDVGRVKPTDSLGRPAAPGPVGVIPAGSLFVVGDNPDSLDSRYALIGLIPASRVVGQAEPIL
ncbi:MAG: signal peptidase I [Brevundimonas aurantiaca]|jgi:conjugal transfer pilin signal peptidase TrbI|uniref:signal peptidase I n=1 Tax=Brevundimonas aurantiaca TaxID=74316 RepID=UPI00403434D3